jgi:hypothetical protein
MLERSHRTLYPMPDVKDAVKVVTDPLNVDRFSDSHSDVRPVNGKRAINALRAMGAGKGEARTLISDAVREIGGRVDSQVSSSSRSTGPDATKAGDVWYVPVSAIRK